MPAPVADLDQLDAILEQAWAGEPAAVQAFFDHYSKPILQAVRRRLTGDVRVDVDSVDILQETRLQLYLCKFEEKNFGTPEQFLAYFIRVAERVVLQAKRKRFRRTEAKGVQETSMDAISADEAAQLMDRAAGPEVLAEIHDEWENALKQLPAPYRIVAMMLQERYTHQQIADKLMCNVRTVERAVAKLKEKLGLEVKPGDY